MNLKILRIKKGCTMAEVAGQVGITKQRYNQIEKGNISKGYRNEEMWRKLADFFGVDVFALMGSEVLTILPRNEEEKKSLLKHIMDGIE